ncbi:ATP-dependent RNA helicase DHX36 [Elsinoe australis]|uniref:RNA helicase n=1 Tax=Elsinoe australis TaxID=40998 RepID=A0A2P8A8C2_9PEZI|nr:ATP-dependent RNA helicase DHX36 [Elsinoe australis]
MAKKKKPAANPARGFATTSIASKTKVEAPEDTPEPAITASDKANVKEAKPNGTASEGIDHNPVTSERELKDLTPEELEAQLEQSELQQLVELIAPKVKREAARQVSRLETDRRVLRGQAEWLSTSSWFSEETKNRLLQLVASEHEVSDETDTPKGQPLSEDAMLSRIWTLQSILHALEFPEHRVREVIERLLSQPAISEQSTTWGLVEALEWFAVHCKAKELHDYETQKQTESGRSSEEETAIQAQIQAVTKKEQPSKSQKSWKNTINSRSESTATSEAYTPDLKVSDTDSDPEPDEMLSKYVEYKLRLFEHDPETYDDSQPSKKGSAQRLAPKSGQRSVQETKLIQRIEAMKSDPLFDQDRADLAWRQKRAVAFQSQLERKRLGVTKKHEPTADKSRSNSTNAADKAAKEAEAMAADILAADEDNGAGLFEGMFDAPTDGHSGVPKTTSAPDSPSITTRTFNKITGTSPRRVLEETCKSREQTCRIVTKMIPETTYHCRHSVVVQWSKDQEIVEAAYLKGVKVQSTRRAVLVEMINVAASGIEQSEGFVCTAALSAIFSGSPKEDKASLRLPPSFRDLYQEFAQAKQEVVDSKDREIVKSLRIVLQKQKDNDEDQDIVLRKAFRDRSKKSSGTNTPNGTAKQIETKPSEDPQLMELWSRKSSTPAYQTMLQGRKELPMYQFKEHALEAVRKNQVTILCGETGCGKSTQMPSFILEDQLSRGKPCYIYCTEPRRISAISLAQRVSEELGEGKSAVGTNRSMVGYAIRLESQTTAATRLVYATVGIVLRMLESNRGLNDLTHLIIDEVHERSIDTDFLLIVLKSLLVRRPDLKVVLMSATVDADRFSQYLGNAPVITVPGRTFPVRAMYLEDAIEMTGYTIDDQKSGRTDNADDEDDMDADQKTSALDTNALSGYSKSTIKNLSSFDEYKIEYYLIMRLLEQVARAPDLRNFSKAVLVFLPGISEIRQLTDMLGSHPTFSQGWLVIPLHSTFSSDEQQAAFHVPPKGMRKIVLATNIAETGITIPDVTCVIDTGKHKEMRFDERRQLSRLIQSFISRANAKQRRGRAGRVQEGICFHLFTRNRHDKVMAEQQTPEMLRLSLQDLVMRVKICKLGDIETALSEALDPPSIKNIRRAIDALIEVGALTASEELTPLGQQIAKLPLDAQLGKLLLLGSIFSCSDFALTTAAIASSKSPFLNPMNARRQADTVRMGFKRGDSDLLTTFNAYKTWRRLCTTAGISEFEFCKKNFLSPTALANIEELKGQLLSSLLDAGFMTLSPEERSALSRTRHSRHTRNFVPIPASFAANEENETIVCSVIAWSFYPKILVREGKGWRSVANNQSLSLHPTSVNKLSSTPSFDKTKYLSFYSIMQSSSRFTNAQETSPVEVMALLLLAGDARFEFYAGVIIVDGNRLRFKVKSWREMTMIKTLRSKIKGIVEKGWKRPGRELSKKETEWWNLLMDVFKEVWERKERLEK